MKTEEEIRTKLEAIKNDIPKFLDDSWMSNRLQSKKQALEWALED